MSKTAILIAKVLVPGARNTSDPMSGFFLVRKDVVENARLNPRGYKILMEILERTSYSRVEEVPYVFRNRAGGKSKLGPKTIVDFLIHALQLSPLTKFAFVGALGAIVNLMVMAGLLLLGVNKYLASIAGIEAGILFNFPFHEHWTFKSKMKGNWVSRLIGYHLASIGGMVTTLAVMLLLTDVLRVTTPITGQAIGILAGFAVNYGISQTKIWGKIRGELDARRISAAHRRDKKLH
jgi:dolichol-phosphate mannosyltransferase